MNGEHVRSQKKNRRRGRVVHEMRGRIDHEREREWEEGRSREILESIHASPGTEDDEATLVLKTRQIAPE